MNHSEKCKCSHTRQEHRLTFDLCLVNGCDCGRFTWDATSDDNKALLRTAMLSRETKP